MPQASSHHGGRLYKQGAFQVSRKALASHMYVRRSFQTFRRCLIERRRGEHLRHPDQARKVRQHIVKMTFNPLLNDSFPRSIIFPLVLVVQDLMLRIPLNFATSPVLFTGFDKRLQIGISRALELKPRSSRIKHRIAGASERDRGQLLDTVFSHWERDDFQSGS